MTIKFDLLAGLEKLVPGALFKGVFIDHTEAEYGIIIWKDPRPKPSYVEAEASAIIEMKYRIKESINRRTEELIEYGHTWSDPDGIKPVHMKATFQSDVKGLMIANLYTLVSFPYTMKISDTEEGVGIYTTLVDNTALITFYAAAIQYIEGVLVSGRTLKDSLVSMSRSQLEEFRDMR